MDHPLVLAVNGLINYEIVGGNIATVVQSGIICSLAKILLSRTSS